MASQEQDAGGTSMQSPTGHTRNQAKSMAISLLESPKASDGAGKLVSDFKTLSLAARQKGTAAASPGASAGAGANVAAGAATPGTAEKKSSRSPGSEAMSPGSGPRASGEGSADPASSSGEAKGTILFVGDIARSVQESHLLAAFSKHGTVQAVDVKRDPVSHNNLGYGFVQFATRDMAVAAKRAMHGFELEGRKIRIGWAQRNTTLKVTNLDPNVSADEYYALFAQYGPVIATETFFQPEKKFGQVRFKTRLDAEKAKAELSFRMVGQRQIKLGWNQSSLQKHCVHVKFESADVKSLEGITSEVLEKFFSTYGEVQSVNLPRYGNNTLKGYGFVHFEDNAQGEDSAARAIAQTSGTKVGSVVIQCNYGRKSKTRKPNRYGGSSRHGGGGQSYQQPMYYPTATAYPLLFVQGGPAYPTMGFESTHATGGAAAQPPLYLTPSPAGYYPTTQQVGSPYGGYGRQSRGRGGASRSRRGGRAAARHQHSTDGGMYGGGAQDQHSSSLYRGGGAEGASGGFPDVGEGALSGGYMPQR